VVEGNYSEYEADREARLGPAVEIRIASSTGN
jgi:hypothetical protein